MDELVERIRAQVEHAAAPIGMEEIPRGHARRRSRLVNIAAVAAIAVLVIGITVTRSEPDFAQRTLPPGQALLKLEDFSRLRFESIDMISHVGRLTDLLPGTYVTTGAQQAPDNLETEDTTVVAHVERVDPGVGYRLPGDGEPETGPDDGQTKVPFNAPDADWRTIHLTLRVERTIAGRDLGDTIVVGQWAPDMTIEDLDAAYRELGTAVWFLGPAGAVYDYEPSLHSIAFQGAAIAAVDPRGSLSLPFLPGYTQEGWLDQVATLDQLITAASTPLAILDMDMLKLTPPYPVLPSAGSARTDTTPWLVYEVDGRVCTIIGPTWLGCDFGADALGAVTDAADSTQPYALFFGRMPAGSTTAHVEGLKKGQTVDIAYADDGSGLWGALVFTDGEDPMNVLRTATVTFG